MPNNHIDFKTAFEAMPGSFLIIQPDAPHYTIMAISNELLQITGVKREYVLGKSFFEVFPRCCHSYRSIYDAYLP